MTKVFTGHAARLWKFAAMTMLETLLLVFITCNRDCQFAPQRIMVGMVRGAYEGSLLPPPAFRLYRNV